MISHLAKDRRRLWEPKFVILDIFIDPVSSSSKTTIIGLQNDFRFNRFIGLVLGL